MSGAFARNANPTPAGRECPSWHDQSSVARKIKVTFDSFRGIKCRTMKELTAAFHSEVFRPIVSLVVPGFFATLSTSIVLWQKVKFVPMFVDSHPGTATVMMFLIILTAGLITEDVGSRLESFFDKKLCNVTGYERHREEWYDYLRLAFEQEPVGHRYLRSLVLRLKFELGMTIASIPFALGAIAIEIPCFWRIVVGMISIAGLFYFGLEAKTSNQELSNVRREVLRSIGKNLIRIWRLEFGDYRPSRRARTRPLNS